jgi:uncharacterized protein (TIGR03067 family)
MRHVGKLWSSAWIVGLAMLTQPCVAQTKSPERTEPAAVKRDRSKIAGEWTISELVINGNPAPAEDRSKLRVKNDVDGTWTLISEGRSIDGGTSTLHPDEQPKQIDFKLTRGDGAGREFVGIYKLDGDRRTLCFAAKQPEADRQGRPKSFVSQAGQQHILVRFERMR